MSTNLSGNILTLGNASLNESCLKFIRDQYAPNDNCSVGDTVILDGIECLCVATGVTIQGSSLRRIAVDKNHDLGYYQKYVGLSIKGYDISDIVSWRWGGSGTSTGNTSTEVGYGLQNTINCLANPVNYTNGDSSSAYADYPLMWTGVSDFRSSHSDKWFVPSLNELKNYVYANKNSLTFDTTTGGSSTGDYWSSSEGGRNYGYVVYFSDGRSNPDYKTYSYAVRLCRAF